MPKVELIYDGDCPNVEAARQQLRRAFEQIGRFAEWHEWDHCDPSSPHHALRYGSPTILVDGKDVLGALPVDGAGCCRVYLQSSGFQGVPPVEAITTALQNNDTTSDNANGAVPPSLAVLPAVGVAILPNLTCPACWPAYAGLFGLLGLGFLTQRSYLLPITVVFLVVAALAFRPSNRHGYGPFLVGLVAATVVIVGRYLFDSSAAMYGGIALLIGATTWNTWRKQKTLPRCSVCVEAGNH